MEHVLWAGRFAGGSHMDALIESSHQLLLNFHCVHYLGKKTEASQFDSDPEHSATLKNCPCSVFHLHIHPGKGSG